MVRTFSRLVLALAAASVAVTPSLAADPIIGAGSSAAAPVYKIWATEYARSQGGTLSYDPAGSGAGMARIKKHQVDFGASDFMASPADLKASDLVMFPTVITGVVPVVNLARVGANALHLSGEVLARIYLGEITSWDAPEIRALNPELRLPAHPIRLVARADGSGTTYHFSDYLSRVSPPWKQKHGVAPVQTWPAGTLAVKGSAGVAQAVKDTPDAIGYIDYNYVVDDGLTPVSMQNAEGKFVNAGVDTFRAAVMHSAWFAEGDFSGEITQMPGELSWPITMGTYVAVPRVSADGQRTERALRFITWGYLHGDALARQARFVPLPEKVQASAYREIARVASQSGELLGAKLMGHLVD